MKEIKAPEFYESCTSDQLLEFTGLIQQMAKDDVIPMMAETKHIEGFVQEITHFLKIGRADGEGLEYLAVDMDYFWKDDEVKSRAVTVYVFDDSEELEIERYKMHATEKGANPILN